MATKKRAQTQTDEKELARRRAKRRKLALVVGLSRVRRRRAAGRRAA